MVRIANPGSIGWAFVTCAAVAMFVAAVTPAAAADVDAGRRKAERCAACHGHDGNATVPGTPSLAGMGAFYTHWQLIMFRDGRRRDSQMTPFVQNLTDEDLGICPPTTPPRRRVAGRRRRTRRVPPRAGLSR